MWLFTFEVFGGDMFGGVDKSALVGMARQVAKVLPEVGHASGTTGQDGRGKGQTGLHVAELLKIATQRRKRRQVGTHGGEQLQSLRPRGLGGAIIRTVEDVAIVAKLGIRAAFSVPDALSLPTHTGHDSRQEEPHQ